ncbi:MAG: lipopolysaccharide heptosyltransferase family protein [Betaproteobacteria bacterium]|nr:MAG: lipopolysaccharide heptosyltransferase family protein [Betaproteobacteria bacterium]
MRSPTSCTSLRLVAEGAATPPAIGSVLVINVSRIGDTLLATPALRALARAFPDAAITCLAHPRRAEVLEHLPFLAQVGRIDKRSAPLLGRLPGRRYDLAFVYGFDRALVAYALRVARRVVAFRQGDAALDARLQPAVAEPPALSRHAVFMRLALLEPLGIRPAGLRLAYQVTREERAWARERLGALGPRRPCIGLQVASFPTKAYRDWPVECFAELAARVRARWPETHFVIFGGSEEKTRTAWLAGQLGAAATSFAGALSLRQSAALMSCAHLYVGVDTGPTHIMGCFDIPLVALYHCHSSSRLLGALEHPCFYPVDHPHPHPCAEETPMSAISVDTVFAAVARALEEHPPAP